MGGSSLVQGHAEKGGGGGTHGREWRLATWAGTTWTRQLWAVSTVAGGTCLVGAARAGLKHGKVVRARRGVDATNRRGAGGRGESGAVQRRGANMQARPAQCRAARFKLGLKPFQNF
jgi:hypothetical protein